MAYQQYYQVLGLPPVPLNNYSFQRHQRPIINHELRNIITKIENIELQEEIKSVVEKTILDWTGKHDDLILTLKQLEITRNNMERQLQVQSKSYKKAIKEAQMYRARYNNLNRRYSLESNLQIPSKCNNSSFRSSQYSTMTTPTLDFSIDSVSSKLGPGSDEDCDFDMFSISSNPFDSSLMYLESLVDREDKYIENETKETKDDTKDLIFACNDGFWATIGHENSNKTDVDILVSKYLSRGGNPNVAKSSESDTIVKEGYSLIHALVATKNTKTLRRVLQAGGKPNIFPLTDKAEERITPLILAVRVRHLNSIRALVEKSDADLVNATGPLGENVLHAAIEKNSGEIVDYILQVSQNTLIEKKDNNGATPLHYACITGRTRLITLLVRDRHANISPHDNKGATPLHYAVRYRQLKSVTTLIELGADPNVSITKQIGTPLDLSKSNGFDNITEYLKCVGGKTTKELEKTNRNRNTTSSIFSGDSTGSSEMNSPNKSIKSYLHMKTSQILKGK